MWTGSRGRTLQILAAALLLAVGMGSEARAELPGSTLVFAGSVWSYLDDGSDQGTAWRAPGFVESWPTGPAQLGYGDNDEATEVNCGPSAPSCNSNNFTTTYFRHSFNVIDPGTSPALNLSLLRDDGAVVYLNGTEVARINMPGTVIGYLTPAVNAIGGSEEDTFFDFCVPAGLLVAGSNVLAVEIHQANPGSSDISFDLSLSVVSQAPSPALERGPYLQNGTPDSVVVRWRTDVCSDETVSWGDAPGNLTNSVSPTSYTTEHEVEISGLDPETKYFYSVGTTSGVLAGADADHFFKSLPTAGARRPTRIWVIGDSGQCGATNQGCIDAGDVRDAYLAFAGSDIADVWMMLGDNAYTIGTDQQYTDAVFDLYPEVLRNTLLWPTPGNHEFGASDSPTQTGPYYESFTMPTQAEAGGVASGTEAYYSFDYANVHFVALDSHDTSRAAPANPETNVCPAGQGGAMYQWLCADLAATNQDFIIAYWHHPPYTKGSHDSDDSNDSGGRMFDMRERFLPVLEMYGVDLQLTGHSHAYERSVLIDGHYGESVECELGECFVDGGDGDPDPGGDGAYAKTAVGPVAHEGTLYSVVGSSSKTGGGPLNHPVMEVSLNELGSLVVDVVGRQLDGYFINDMGTVRDHFQLVKGPALPECSDGMDNDGDGAFDFPEDIGCWDADWIEAPQCSDGMDNDADTFYDWDGAGMGAADPQCTAPWKNKEKASACGLGAELTLAFLPLAAAWRRRSRQASRRIV